MLMMRSSARRLALCALAVAAYPLTVLGFVYWHTFMSDLPGGRHGPTDAYRHTLASAFVAYTLSPRAVALVTRVMERGDGVDNRMDRRNNAIGAAIGASAVSLSELSQRVLERVRHGEVNAPDAQQVTWLPSHKWRNRPI